MKITYIHSNPSNPRVIKDDKFKKLVASIKDFPKMMELRPIIIDDTNTILGGNMRYKALQEAGYTEIPDEWVKKANDLTEEEKKQFIIKDNLPFGEWDWDVLANEFEVKDLLDWGFDEKDLKIEQEVVEDEVPQVSDEPAVSKLGEVYQLGRHRLMCGDSTKIEDVERLMKGQKADMVFTDPPYGVDRGGGFGGFGGFGKPIARRNYDNDEWDKERIPKGVFDNLFVLSEKLIIFGGNFYTDYLPVSGHWIVWDKKQTMPTFGDCELAWTNSNRKSIKKYEVEYNGLIGKEPERYHPTQKPLKLCVDIIKDYSEDNQSILEYSVAQALP